VSPELAAIEIVWCKTDEGSLLAAHLPEFWQHGDERVKASTAPTPGIAAQLVSA
jgi:hypothetical protein